MQVAAVVWGAGKQGKMSLKLDPVPMCQSVRRECVGDRVWKTKVFENEGLQRSYSENVFFGLFYRFVYVSVLGTGMFLNTGKKMDFRLTEHGIRHTRFDFKNLWNVICD